jgi:antitoxin component of RelBE/YafQ-DinJ toxin-antitoxin module
MAVPAKSLVCRHILSSWRSLTPSRVLRILLLSFAGTFLFPPSLTMAQTAAGSSAAATKQMQKEEQKADRKARRAKKNAELKKSEQNGYQPGWGDNADSQQSLQNAPRKGKSPKAGNASPASAP